MLSLFVGKKAYNYCFFSKNMGKKSRNTCRQICNRLQLVYQVNQILSKKKRRFKTDQSLISIKNWFACVKKCLSFQKEAISQHLKIVNKSSLWTSLRRSKTLGTQSFLWKWSWSGDSKRLPSRARALVQLWRCRGCWKSNSETVSDTGNFSLSSWHFDLFWSKCFSFWKIFLKALENAKSFPYNKRGKLFRDGETHEKKR